MQSQFKLERRVKQRYSTFFPEAIQREAHTWGQTLGGVTGEWTCYRLVTGKLDVLHARIQKIADEFSVARKLHEQIDILRLFEESESVRATPIMIYDYSGRIETLSRESVIAQHPGGSRTGLWRDVGFGFRGIAVRTDEAWSAEQYALDMVARLRIRALNLGRSIGSVSPVEPWRLRQSAEDQLQNLLAVAWTQHAIEPTPTTLEEVIMVEKELNAYILSSLDWLTKCGDLAALSRVPFPDSETARRLWEQTRISRLLWDETFPWYGEMPEPQAQEITACLGAYIQNPKYTITIQNNPVLSMLSHPMAQVFHQRLGYGPHRAVGVGIPNTGADREKTPFVGVGNASAWDGAIPRSNPWSVVKADGPMPEPRLKVRTRYITVPRQVAERLEAALVSEKPVLTFENLNNAVCPLLVMPRQFVNVNIVPLFGGGRTLTPIREHNAVEGWAVDATAPLGPTGSLIAQQPDGFLSTPAQGRPLREGNIQELIPIA